MDIGFYGHFTPLHFSRQPTALRPEKPGDLTGCALYVHINQSVNHYRCNIAIFCNLTRHEGDFCENRRLTGGGQRFHPPNRDQIFAADRRAAERAAALLRRVETLDILPRPADGVHLRHRGVVQPHDKVL